ncbi:SDR family oxidoreductase [Halorubellus sp. PRR65]|uniref:SDR family oxidoreductase n=1 Tax=Halorubellus sp. PRR65 TaxID=3098148 RepID=UPI002B257642|nr:SDR family oxidoreductase [Halorubellus sp. PRR65]
MPDDTILLTGFPGFLGSALVDRLLNRGEHVTCLIQSKYRDLAADRRDDLEAEHDAEGRIALVEGDITDPDLGLPDDGEFAVDALADRTSEVYHLAAVYDLGVDRDLAMAVNVDGTEHVLDFCDACDDLDRLHYVSTCYVSGRYPGEFTEDMLVEGQSFNNHYESTKFLAEVRVQDAMDDGLPATLYRPSIAVGDSETGETQKYDGPYHLVRYFLDQPGIAVVPEFGDPGAVEVNVVPRDFVVDAIDAISARADTVGEVYQLADPDPPSVAEMQAAFAAATNTWTVDVPFSKTAFQWLLREVDSVRDWTGIDPAIVDYFTHPTRYDTANATAVLADAGVECPDFREYAPRLVDYVRRHPHVGSDAMT